MIIKPHSTHTAAWQAVPRRPSPDPDTRQATPGSSYIQSQAITLSSDAPERVNRDL